MQRGRSDIHQALGAPECSRAPEYIRIISMALLDSFDKHPHKSAHSEQKNLNDEAGLALVSCPVS